MNLFKQPDPKEIQRQQQRELKTSNRELERDQRDLEKQEKQIEADIKKAAKLGNQTQVKTLAKQLIRVREAKSKNQQAQSTISGIGHRAKAMQSQVAVGKAMATASKVMGVTNKTMPVAQVQKTMQAFQKESMAADMKEEMMMGIIDDVMGGEEDEEEGENIMNQILDEIGVEVGSSMSSVPKGKLPQKASAAEEDKEDDDLLARLQSLK